MLLVWFKLSRPKSQKLPAIWNTAKDGELKSKRIIINRELGRWILDWFNKNKLRVKKKLTLR